MKGGVRLGILAIAGVAAFALSWFLPPEDPPEPARTDIHSKTELLRLLPGLGDVPELENLSTNSFIQGVVVASLSPNCLPRLTQSTVDIAPPFIMARYDLVGGPSVAVEFGRIGPDSADKARYLLRSAKQRCSEEGAAYEVDPKGTWTFQQVTQPRIGEVSVAFTGDYAPPSDTARDSEARIVCAISKEWAITFITDEASGKTLDTLMPRILAGLDANVGSAFTG
ncbi:hypothetical protein ACFOY2_17505 [Nonomuraea purpurea]|uniref:Sensor domain-containing protein n=1 Tax=Nonomuraea purpurea TaxID=1849276 RepID=A0ABV8G4V0_9ACTN